MTFHVDYDQDTLVTATLLLRGDATYGRYTECYDEVCDELARLGELARVATTAVGREEIKTKQRFLEHVLNRLGDAHRLARDHAKGCNLDGIVGRHLDEFRPRQKGTFGFETDDCHEILRRAAAAANRPPDPQRAMELAKQRALNQGKKDDSAVISQEFDALVRHEREPEAKMRAFVATAVAGVVKLIGRRFFELEQEVARLIAELRDKQTFGVPSAGTESPRGSD